MLPHWVDEGEDGGVLPRREAERHALAGGFVSGPGGVPALRPQNHLAPKFFFPVQPGEDQLRPDGAGLHVGPQAQSGHGQGRRGFQLKLPHNAVPVGLAVLGELVGPGIPLPEGGVHGVGHPGGGVVHLHRQGVGVPRTAQGGEVIAVGGGAAFTLGPRRAPIHPHPGLFRPLQVQDHRPSRPVRRNRDLPPVSGGAGVDEIPMEVARGNIAGVIPSLAVFIHGAGKPDGPAGKDSLLCGAHIKLPDAGQINGRVDDHTKTAFRCWYRSTKTHGYPTAS